MKVQSPFAAYDIPLQAMPNGEHRYSFALKGDFFGLFEASLITEAQIQVELQILRMGSRLDCTFRSEGSMQVGCARCLEPLGWPIQDESHLVVQCSDSVSELDSDEILVLPSGEISWNVAQFIYESIHLHYPLRAVCDEASLPCRSQEPWSEQSLLTYQTSDNSPTDPRWDRLKHVNFQ
ncbi:MAG: YceD family protein [Bacteroidota bacterium]